MSEASDFFAAVRALLGGRVAQCRLEDLHRLCVTVIDLDDADESAVGRLAAELGVGERIRVEPADPAHLAAWESLRHDLLALQAAARRVLLLNPTPDPGYRRPPVRIGLTATAEDVAADLHERYADFVALQVGARAYPPDPDRPAPERPTRPARTPVSPDELRVGIDGGLAPVAGERTGHVVSITNLTDVHVEVHTTGSITAEVADPADGRVIGVSSGFRATPLVGFDIVPGATVRIPLLVGTDCLEPALGYVVPPGEWLMVVPLDLADGRRLEARLPLTITPPMS